MLQATLRLVVISAATVIVAIFALLGLRYAGLAQKHSPAPHDWFEWPRWSIYAPEDPCLVPQTFGSDWIVQIPVEKSGDEWVLRCPHAESVLLSDYLRRSEHRHWLIKIHHAADTHLLDKLVSDLDDLGKKFAVRSDSQIVSRYLRKKAPQWLFAADPSSLLRLTIFTNIWVEPIIDFWPDFVILTDGQSPTPRALNEVTRRQKRIIVEDLSGGINASELPPHANGLLTTRSSKLTPTP